MKKTGFKYALAIVLVASSLSATVSPSEKPAARRSTLEDRIVRVENGLLPAFTISGRPLPLSSLAGRMAALNVPGVSVAVINDGAVEWARGYGVLEAGTAGPVTAETLFQAASISKSVAALAAMRLVERGDLALDEDVNVRLKSWKVPENEFTKTEKVTLRRLLSHTAGLTVHGFGGYPAGAPVPSIVQVLDGEKPANSPPVRVDIVPGGVNRYSGGGFTVMQLLLTDVTGKAFPDLISELVLEPIGMAHSTYEQPLPPGRREEAATAHHSNGNPVPGRFHTYPEMAAAGLWTTPTDLARFLLEIRKALAGRSEVLGAETARLMTTPVKPGYGLGLSLEGLGPAATFGHGGSNEGYKCQMTAFFAKGQGAVIMTNGDEGGYLCREVLRSIAREYDWPAYRPVEKNVVRVDPKILSTYTGRYELSPGRVVKVVLQGETLSVLDGPRKIELYAEAENRFFETMNESLLAFIKGTDGKIAFLLINGQTQVRRIGD
jgi:CubicO group peptidase (beta-lactamase class C family)